ncbi:TPA: glycosyltransferase [Photobacterium damselae]
MMEFIVVVISNRKTIIISMSGRDSAMWFSFTGLYQAIKERNVNIDFAFPSSDIEKEEQYLDNIFFYDLKYPIKTFNSINKLADKINLNYNNVVIFSQGFFSALLTVLLNKDIEITSWGHELINHTQRAGFFRGLNYSISDKIMALKTKKIIVASDELKDIANKKYPKHKIIKSYLPISGDFSLLFNNNVEFVKNKVVNILFFGYISSYKGLDVLSDLIEKIDESKLHITILGRGNLEKYAPNLYLRANKGKNVTWVNKFVSAENVVVELEKSDFMYTMYNSVTATSQIDIAHSFGVPVLASKLSFFQDKIKNGENGYCLNPESLLEYIEDYIDGNITFSHKEIKENYFKVSVNKLCVDSLFDNEVL